MRTAFLSCLPLLPLLALCMAPTDEIRDADMAQSGYLDNHNMDPDTVASSAFRILWKNIYGTDEQWYARPLVFTPRRRKQLVFLASSKNVIRTVDAVDGSLIKERALDPPFLVADTPKCPDIPNFIGIIGTPIIDPKKEIAYFFSNSYRGGASGGGLDRAIHQLYAVDVHTLEDVPGFPVLIDGHFADNDPQRYFISGTLLQRPAVTIVNDHVIGAFAGHCDMYNYTGMLMSVGTKPGAGVASIYAMEASPGAPPVVSDINLSQGGKAGIWQGGMGIAAVGDSMYITTGNGMGEENKDKPASGRDPLSTLDDVVARFKVSKSGKLVLKDYFQPYDYLALNAAGKDLGSSGPTMLDKDTFRGRHVKQMVVTVGKAGTVYVLNSNDLGGFMNGPNGTDQIVQILDARGPVFGAIGSFPLDGGYIYWTPLRSQTVAYKFGRDCKGRPFFSFAGASLVNGTGVGMGAPTTTSYKGRKGTGIVWFCDLANGLKAFHAVPTKDGVLEEIDIPATGPVNKFLRPAFGDGRVYVPNLNGSVVCLGTK